MHRVDAARVEWVLRLKDGREKAIPSVVGGDRLELIPGSPLNVKDVLYSRGGGARFRLEHDNAGPKGWEREITWVWASNN